MRYKLVGDIDGEQQLTHGGNQEWSKHETPTL
jgi:hypothetical protein